MEDLDASVLCHVASSACLCLLNLCHATQSADGNTAVRGMCRHVASNRSLNWISLLARAVIPFPLFVFQVPGSSRIRCNQSDEKP